MQRTLKTLGLCTLALIAGGATLQKAEPAARIVDAATGETLRQARTTTSRSERVIRAPGYQDVRIVISPGPRAKQLPRGPREVALCKVGAADSDGDGLCDAAEQRYRTLADEADTDGDAISDRIEIYGEALPDGSAFSPEAYGASPGHRDLFVYVNWTKRWPAKQAALDMVVAAFQRAPGTNPDGTTGIQLHFILGGEITYADDLPYTEEGLTALRNQHLPWKVSFPLHYLIFSDHLQARDASGVSPSIPGLNFAVTPMLVKNLTLLGEAGTIMHELGHNLGLKHGGNDDDNFKPNYMSVMNYLYQFDGLQQVDGDVDTAPRVLDFTRFATAAVDERRLDEVVGFATHGEPDGITLYKPLYCKQITPKKDDCHAWGFINGSVPGGLDFNGNGRISRPVRLLPLRGDLNGDGMLEGFPGGQNDWAVITFAGGANGISRAVTDTPHCPLPQGTHTPTGGPIPLLEDPDATEPAPEPGEPSPQTPPVEPTTPPVEPTTPPVEPQPELPQPPQEEPSEPGEEPQEPLPPLD